MPHPAHSTLGQSSYPRWTRSLSAVESWGFGLTAHISWVALVPAIHAALGSQAIFVWIPAVIFGMLLNFIYGNITYANQYIEDLLKLLELYQKNYPNPVT